MVYSVSRPGFWRKYPCAHSSRFRFGLWPSAQLQLAPAALEAVKGCVLGAVPLAGDAKANPGKPAPIGIVGIGEILISKDGGRPETLRPGDFACYDSTRPYTLSFGAQFEQIVLHMPRNAMIRRIGPTEAVTATRVAAESPLGSLVAPFIRNTAAIVSEVGVLPRAHGSALFTRGETQALVVATLGTGEDEQFVDSLEGTYKQHFMLHYNFPPFSVGEVGRMTGAGRREIGHGKLAWRAINPLLPDKTVFPYTIRLVSEITESNRRHR